MARGSWFMADSSWLQVLEDPDVAAPFEQRVYGVKHP